MGTMERNGYGGSVRAICSRCRRPVSVCYCTELRPVRTRTRVVLLQHARERKVAIGTARIAHLALEGSELFVGVDFSSDPRIQSLAAARDGSVAVLFPGEGAEPAARL